ncbi:hypothetical protein HW115_09800 [Verrucomicrobiaceae bacterium N1E253]|uniref:Uncharacterized protein n=1 Tax=Oceaniferula marina TaxID=2748318 RepID=A0A851GL53_9BACT|nr:hypothetical protein [Oceaniferula marina]NWK55905.1 hypothetical protein [Oceaniferula marina]
MFDVLFSHFRSVPCSFLGALTALVSVTCVDAKEPAELETIAEVKVVYALDKKGKKQSGKLRLQMNKGEQVMFLGDPHKKGTFTLTLTKQDGRLQITSLNPLCLPLTFGDPLMFPVGPWKIVTSDFNRDGISEFNLSQPGNSWGSHYMLFTFSDDGKGKVQAVRLDDEPDENYLHPQCSLPSTDVIRATKEGFCFMFTERGNIEDVDVDIHYRWNKKKKCFEEWKRVACTDE